MSTSQVTPFHQAATILDPLTEIARDGARQMLAAALKADATSFVAQFADERLPDGRQRVVLHGAGPERTIQTGIGPPPVRRPPRVFFGVRDRASDAPADEKRRFTSAILPRWARRTRSLDALLPILHLRGVFTGDFQEAPSALLGADAPIPSPGPPGLASLDCVHWTKSSGQARTSPQAWAASPPAGMPGTTAGAGATSRPGAHVYVRADGVHLQARMERAAPNACW